MGSATVLYFKRVSRERGGGLCRLGEAVLALLGAVLTLVAFGAPFWLLREQLVEEEGRCETRHSGLWQQCSRSYGCLQLSETTSHVIASRLFMCLALGAGLFAWVVSIVGLIQHRAVWLMISGVCYAVQALLMLIGLASFAAEFRHGNPGWVYGVGWAGCLVSLLSSVYSSSIAVWLLRKQRAATFDPTASNAPLALFQSASESESDSENEKL